LPVCNPTSRGGQITRKKKKGGKRGELVAVARVLSSCAKSFCRKKKVSCGKRCFLNNKGGKTLDIKENPVPSRKKKEAHGATDETTAPKGLEKKRRNVKRSLQQGGKGRGKKKGNSWAQREGTQVLHHTSRRSWWKGGGGRLQGGK